MVENSSKNSGDGGNTKPSPKQEAGAKKWCFTHNLENQSKDMDVIQKFVEPILKKLNSICKYFIFSLEEGEEKKRLHLQGYIHLGNKIRLSGLKNIINSKTHWEKAKGGQQDNYIYITKNPLKTWEYNNKSCKYTVEQLGILKENELFDWQLNILDILKKQPEKRIIYWYYSKLYGGIGKTEFTKYLVYHHGAKIVDGDKKDVMTQILGKEGNNETSNIYIWNIEKANKSLCYSALERVKDGIITTTKYDGKTELIPVPHIIVFANFAPNTKKIFEDRFIVTRLDYGPENGENDEIEID